MQTILINAETSATLKHTKQRGQMWRYESVRVKEKNVRGHVIMSAFFMLQMDKPAPYNTKDLHLIHQLLLQSFSSVW